MTIPGGCCRSWCPSISYVSTTGRVLNVVNVEADHGASLGALRTALYGPPNTDALRYDEIGWTFYITVLRPLCWAGLLQADPLGRMSMDAQFFKTAIWRRYLRLDTDRLLEKQRLH